MIGTPGFWAPEQAAGERERQGPATDVYGLGATLYAALTGQPPVDGVSLVEVLMRTRGARPAPPSQHTGRPAPALDALVLRCLALEPAERPTLAVLERELRACRDAASGVGPRSPLRGPTLAATMPLARTAMR